MTGAPEAAQRVEVQINFADLRDLADQGVRRASVFLGIASNAGAARPRLSHVLDDRVQYNFVPNEVTPEVAAHFTEEFVYWAMGNALRELVDTFSLFLVECRPVVRLLEAQAVAQRELAEIHVVFEQRNVVQQYQEMRELLNLDAAYSEMFETFRMVRNCLAHRRGVVALRDVNTPDNRLKLRWCYIGTFIRHANGNEIALDNNTLGTDGIIVGEGGAAVVAHLAWREKTFAVGQQIALSRHDLGEICFGVHLATTHVIEKMQDLARVRGILEPHLEQADQGASEAPAPATNQNLDRDN